MTEESVRLYQMLNYIESRVSFERQFDWNVEDIEESLYTILATFGFEVRLSTDEEREMCAFLEDLAEREEVREVVLACGEV